MHNSRVVSIKLILSRTHLVGQVSPPPASCCWRGCKFPYIDNNIKKKQEEDEEGKTMEG
jgi:hypothetical protein